MNNTESDENIENIETNEINETKVIPYIIIKKKNLQVIKNKTNDYSILYNINNPNIYLPQIINLSFIQLIYQLNKEVFEDCHIQEISETESKVYILVKHYFKELGLPKRYTYLNTKIIKTETEILFKFSTIYDELPPNSVNMPQDATLLPMDNMDVIYHIIDQHNVVARHDIHFATKFDIPEFVEKFSLTLFSKMFIRTKQFIDNIK